MSITPTVNFETAYWLRFAQVAERVGDNVLQRDVTAYAVAKTHCIADDFDLVACLADMVRHLAESKQEIMRNYLARQEFVAMPMIQLRNDTNGKTK